MEGVTTTNVTSTGALDGDWKPDGNINGNPYFDCDPATFYKCVQGRMKGKHWKKFLGGEFGEGVKQWAAKNRNSNFMLRNKEDGSFIYANKIF